MGETVSGFCVDLPTLAYAAAAINAVLRELAACAVESIDCPSAAIGHRRLARAVHSFCERWQLGLAALAEDGRQLASRLNDTVTAYADADVDSATQLTNLATGLEPQ